MGPHTNRATVEVVDVPVRQVQEELLVTPVLIQKAVVVGRFSGGSAGG